MPFPFTCPHCGQTTNVDDQYAGQTGPCGACGQTVTITPPGPATQFQPVPAKKGGCGWVVYTLLGVFLLALVSCGGVATMAGFSAKYRMECSDNLKNLTLAMHNYHDMHKTFPPAILTDADGRPRRSWRVAVLPYCEAAPLYEAYDDNQPWDSEHNLTVAETMPDVFRCPSDKRRFKTIKGHRIPCSNYVMIMSGDPVGGKRRNAVGGVPNQGVKFSYISDGTSYTFMFVEVTGEDCPAWTEPVDLSFDDIANGINAPNGVTSIRSNHPGGANAAFADGAVHFLHADIDRETLDAFATRAGSEVVDRNSLNTP